jgi:hypothetical protein
MGEYNGLSRDYLLNLAPLEHYLTRASQLNDQELGLKRRWMNLAARTLLQRPIVRYSDAINLNGQEDERTKSSINEIEEIVQNINSLISNQDASSLTNPKEEMVSELRNMYNHAKRIIFGV